MSFLVEDEHDRQYIQKLHKDIKILSRSRIDWTTEDVTRFAGLLSIDESLAPIIKSFEIDGGKLFDTQHLQENMDIFVTSKTFFPINKLLYVVQALEVDEQELLFENSTANHLNASKKEEMTAPQWENGPWADIEHHVMAKLLAELAQVEGSIVEMSCGQVVRLLKRAELAEESEEVRKYSVDGFSLVCLLANQHLIPTLRNNFSQGEVSFLLKLSQIFLHLYFHQLSQPVLLRKFTHSFDNNTNDMDINFEDILLQHSGVKASMGESEYGTSEQGDSRGYALSVAGSVRNSQYATSEMGSVRGSAYYAESEVGSVRNLAESVYASSEIMEDTTMESSLHSHHKQRKQEITISAIEDDESIKLLMEASMELPFSLLNLDSLQKVKIGTVQYPFNFKKSPFARQDSKEPEDMGRRTSKMTDATSVRLESIYDLLRDCEEIAQTRCFHLSGVRFGRLPQNDYSYPDELSISGKHAQIVFKEENYYLRDLGSKTGTYLYISETKPLVLKDEQIIQLSLEVELKVTIIKNDTNEGVIKIEFKKPDNELPYRAILKSNNVVRIGKSDKCHIVLSSQSLSSYHAEIKYLDGRFLMYDCNTRTGTWLRLSSRGNRSADFRLTPMDIIRISSKKTFLIQEVSEGVGLVHQRSSLKG